MTGTEHKDVTSEGSLDPVFLVNTLHSQGFQVVHEPGLGNGYAFSVGHDDTEARVGIFPQAGAVEVVSGSSILRLEKIVRIRRRDEHVVFEALQDEERVTLEISPEGRFALTRQPLVTPDDVTPEDALPLNEPAARLVPTPPTPPAGIREHAARPSQSKPPQQPEPQDHPPSSAVEPGVAGEHELEENERVTIRGRVGKEAHFRTSGRRGVLIGSFPLGEHPDLETTIWHTVVLFGDRAAKLKEKGLTAGQEIEVVGYVHERQIKGSDSEKSKTVKEIYATAIRTTLRTPDDKP